MTQDPFIVSFFLAILPKFSLVWLESESASTFVRRLLTKDPRTNISYRLPQIAQPATGKKSIDRKLGTKCLKTFQKQKLRRGEIPTKNAYGVTR